MTESWSDTQRALRESVLQFARQELNPRVAELGEGGFDPELWRRCAEFGVLGWLAPRDHGGAGHGVVTTAYLMEALGYGCVDNGLTFGLGTQIWGFQKTLLEVGSEDQVSRYLGPSVRGELLGAFAITEEGSGSDAFGIGTRAVRDGDHYVLEGEKVYIGFAPVAQVCVVFARTDPQAGRWGISAFLVDAGTPGYTVEPAPEHAGLRRVPPGRIVLDGCRVPRDRLLGGEGGGAGIFNLHAGWERSMVLAPQLGAMQRLLDASVEVARTRIRAGRPVGKHQAVSHRVADMKLRIELSRLLLYKTARLLQEGRSATLETAMTKTFLSEASVQCAQDAIAVHGGEGYQRETGLERELRDAIGATIYAGTVDVQRNIIAGLLGL
ncbi:MAG: acyl-CoA dehydrogenase family protein [Gemmatimonadota bacterium]